jgi:hypothetical protein
LISVRAGRATKPITATTMDESRRLRAVTVL